MRNRYNSYMDGRKTGSRDGSTQTIGLAVMRCTKAFARAVLTIWEELDCESPRGLVSISPMIDYESAVLNGGRNGKDGE